MRMLTTASGVGRGVAGSSYDERVPTSRGFGPRLHWNVPHGSREILGVSSIMTLRDVDGGRSGVATSGRTFAADGASLRRALARWSDLKPSLDMFPTACARASSLHIGTAGWLPAAASGPGLGTGPAAATFASSNAASRTDGSNASTRSGGGNHQTRLIPPVAPRSPVSIEELGDDGTNVFDATAEVRST